MNFSSLNDNFLANSIQNKIIAALAVMFGLLALTVVLNFNAFGSLDGSAPMVNQAGAQRMRTFKTATLANEFNRADAAARPAIAEELNATIGQFDQVQAGLAAGDAQFNLSGTSDQGIIDQLAVVNDQWTVYKSNLETVLGSDTEAMEALGRVNGSVGSVFSNAAAVVGAQNSSQVSAIDIDQAGAQRMRVFRMAFEANSFADASAGEKPELAAGLRSTMADFEAVQAGLRSGDTARGLKGTSDTAILAKLDDVDATYVQFEHDLELILNQGSDSETALIDLDHRANGLFGTTAATVTTMNTSQVSLVDLDSAGGQRMRAYRVAYLANEYLAAETDAERADISEELWAQADTFDAVQAGLRSGDPSRGLLGTSNPAVLSTLDSVDTVWADYKADLHAVETFDPSVLDALSALSASAPALFGQANTNVSLVSDEAQGVVSDLKRLEIILIIISLFVLAGIIWFVKKTIVNALIRVAEAAQMMSTQAIPQLVTSLGTVESGDLGARVNFDLKRVDNSSKDEVGQIANAFNDMSDKLDEAGESFNRMVAGVADVIGEVTNTAGELASASAELASSAGQAGDGTNGIATAAQEIASGSVDQRNGVEETMGAVTQLASAIDSVSEGSRQQTQSINIATEIVSQVSSGSEEVATNAQAATDGARAANEAAEGGLATVRQTVEGMERITSAVESAAVEIRALGEQSAEIGKIIGVIDDIAAQTNLLALNAAIEAARAGEQGRGFAVVADEVRTLAERVTDATKEISDLIQGVQNGVERSVLAAEQAGGEVEAGSALATSSGEALEEIQGAVSGVTSQIEQISAAAEQVSASADEMVRTIETVKTITEQNTTAADQMSTSSTEVQKSIDGISSVTEQASAAAQQMSASSEEVGAQVQEVVASSQTLSSMADGLKSLVQRFKLTSDSGSAPQVS
ncbi:MAG: type IV pili methyl-accepting chemotaxis transducer N-terminal domain-containing protein [Chloroflexi bacterium]|nr:type IV pili methyl-accepting chemotaxis transducer N-terminal domain-containing protein [Chloroflexota bacterium]